MSGFWDTAGYQPEWANAGPMVESREGGEFYMNAPGDDTNPEGAGDDPFAYTKGSLLTPWEGRFTYAGGSGGSGVAEFKPFDYADFGYDAPRFDPFSEVYNDPGDFTYGDYTSRGDYKGPTERELRADPSYQFRQQQAMDALTASKAAQGILRSGGTLKEMQANASNLASQEYGAVDARKFRDYSAGVDEDRFRYGTNRSNAAENFDRNVRNRETGYQLRQGAWQGNASTGLDYGRFGYDVAQGVYDRNFSKARQGYEDERQHANAVAAAGAAGSARDYNRALQEYQMARDEFWTNQDRQYAILNAEDLKGRATASDYSDRAYGYGAASAENAYQRGNAQASGRIGSSNAWTGALGNIGQGAMDMGLYASTMGRPSQPQPRTLGNPRPPTLPSRSYAGW